MVVDAHTHGGDGGGAWVQAVLALPFVVALVAYAAAAARERAHGRGWPLHRTACWSLGVVAAASGFVGPFAVPAGFTAHMASHLVVGMLAPLLLVLGAPVTLALRTLSVTPARRLTRLLRTMPARVLTFPVVAAVLNVGGLWALYRTPLFGLMQQSMLVHLLVTAHVLAAGYLFTFSIVGLDPSPHRAGFVLRAGVLVAALAAHGILAKTLYAAPPPGVPAPEAQAGAQLMFTGGDLVDLAVLALLCGQWYHATGRRLQPAAVPR